MGERALEFYQLYLQPLSALHLDSVNVTHDYQNLNKSDRTYIYIFLVLAVLILLIATINFMNLSMARLSSRTREVGIRKTVGASQSQVVAMFLYESTAFAVIGVCIAIVMAWLVLPLLNSLINREIQISILGDPGIALVILGMTLLTGIVAGAYPALIASSFSPVNALKHTSLTAHKRLTVQNILVTLQFAVSVGMIVSTMLVLQQLSLIQNRDIGFNNEQILLLPVDNQLRESFSTFKQELLAIPGVTRVTASSQRLGNNLHQGGFQAQGDGPPIAIAPSHIRVEMDYLAFHDIELLDGRDFSRDIATDLGQAFIINQAMLDFLGWDNIRGKKMSRGGPDAMGDVIGLVKDFNFNSLHHQVQPLIIVATDAGFSEISVKLGTASFTDTLAGIEAKWQATGSSLPFDYEFLDQHYQQLYSSDRQVGLIVSGISLLTMVIACFGLYGITSLTLEKRIKEIGIRKVLGAGLSDILLLLNKEFSLLIVIAIIIASPVVWIVINGWLENFAYRIDIGVPVFVAGGLVAALIAILTVSGCVIHAARENPVAALRCE